MLKGPKVIYLKKNQLHHHNHTHFLRIKTSNIRILSTSYNTHQSLPAERLSEYQTNSPLSSRRNEPNTPIKIPSQEWESDSKTISTIRKPRHNFLNHQQFQPRAGPACFICLKIATSTTHVREIKFAIKTSMSPKRYPCLRAERVRKTAA